MRLLALVTDERSITRYLRAVGERTDVPARSPSRGRAYWKSTVCGRRRELVAQAGASKSALLSLTRPVDWGDVLEDEGDGGVRRKVLVRARQSIRVARFPSTESAPCRVD
jgi:hypothetical protein